MAGLQDVVPPALRPTDEVLALLACPEAQPNCENLHP